MGLFRRKDERAIPKPGSREFEEAVRGAPAESAADQPKQPEPVAEEPETTVDEPPRTAEPSGESVEDAPTRRRKVLGSLGRSILKPPNADGFGGGVSGSKKKKP